MLLSTRGGDPLIAQLLDLVFHQADQRRDDDRQPPLHDGGELVAEALARAGRHDAEDVLAGQDVFDHLALAGAEFVEAEDVAERVIEGGHLFGHYTGTGRVGHSVEEKRGNRGWTRMDADERRRIGGPFLSVGLGVHRWLFLVFSAFSASPRALLFCERRDGPKKPQRRRRRGGTEKKCRENVGHR